MEERAFVDRPGGDVLHDQRAGRERRGQACFLQRARRDEPRARSLRPDGREMALARTLRTGEHDRTVRPVRPGLDQRKRCRVRRAAQEILAREALRVVERKGELTGANGHQPGLSPR